MRPMLSLRLLYSFYWVVCLVAFLAQGDQLSFRHNGRDWLSRRVPWRLPIEENGSVMEFYGSLQVTCRALQTIRSSVEICFHLVEAQIGAIKPGFRSQRAYTNHTKTLNKRGKILSCLDEDIDQAQKDDIQNGIAYLRGLRDDAKGGYHGGSNDQNCRAIYCADAGAIKWCNQGVNYFEMPCNKFSDLAQDILNKCSNEWVAQGVEGDLTTDHNIVTMAEDKGHC